MKILIAGGGTGGHVYPAITLAKSFQNIRPGVEIHFVGTPLGIENKIVPREGFPLHLIKVGRLNVGWKEKLITLIRLPLALLSAAFLVWRLKPDLVLGVGGYASGPALLAAALMGRFTAIWEPNATPGLANRILAPFVKLAIVVFDEARVQLKCKEVVRMPMPVRPEIESVSERIAKTPDFCVLVFGGSQGARAINEAVVGAVGHQSEWLKSLRIVHQTGPLEFEKVKNQYALIPHAFGHVECKDYLHDMSSRYQWADLIICRSGTGTLSELAALGKAAILIPLPTAADDHQTKNAEALVQKRAAVMINQKNLTPQALIDLVLEFKKEPERIRELEENIRKLHQKGASTAVASLLLERCG
jgi:UDP-N-acetylglucosamine--N-acetylmuramyl-(pentapeptide) pyrophosphoryl-undecaprenol N-acetylglucosamine transferase